MVGILENFKIFIIYTFFRYQIRLFSLLSVFVINKLSLKCTVTPNTQIAAIN